MKQKLIPKKSRQPIRHFSDSIKRQTVKDIENGVCSVHQAAVELGVSNVSVYKWLEKYSRHLKKSRRMVVEDKSEAYRSISLEARIKELEAALGRKSMELELLQKVIDLANQELNIDLKKNFSDKPLKSSE